MEDDQLDRERELKIARDYLRLCAEDSRNRGHTMEKAIRLVAAHCGMTIRRFMHVRFGRRVRLRDDELAEITAGFERHLEEESRYLRARLTLMEDRLRRLRAGQVIDYDHEPDTAHITRERPPRNGSRRRTTDEGELAGDSDS